MASRTVSGERPAAASAGAESEDEERRNRQQRKHDDEEEMEELQMDIDRLQTELQSAAATGFQDRSDPELPPLPADDDDDDSFLRSDASFLDTSEHHTGVNPRSDVGHTTFDERELRRHLMDVESSFLPEPMPPASADTKPGVDDTYVKFTPSSDAPSASEFVAFSNATSAARTPGAALGNSQSDDKRNREQQQQQQQQQQRQRRRHEHHDEHDDRDDSEDISIEDRAQDQISDIAPSSPAAAAAQRTHFRTTSFGAPSLLRSGHGGDDEDVSPRKPPKPLQRDSQRRSHLGTTSLSRSAMQKHDQDDEGREEDNLSLPEQSTTPPPPQDMLQPPLDMTSLMTLNGVRSLSPNPLPSLPGYRASRQPSQLSVLSAAESYQSGSALDADYALQTGGATASNSNVAHHGLRPAFDPSRLPSFGSVASEVSRDSDDERPEFTRGVSGTSAIAGFRADRHLDSLDEEDRSSTLSDPVTPRPPNTTAFAAPTDTVIAQHIQNIRVPDTIAREFHQRNRSMSPEKRPHSSDTTSFNFQSRPRSSNLTLKEQNSKIDKLTKENFDLKLKIHFLDQALQNRSDEGVKDMINKNVQYQTDLANERKESQNLKRRIRDMERKLHELEEQLSEARKGGHERNSSSQEEMEYEVMQLSEEVDRCQVMITRLSAENMAKEVEKRKMAEYISAMNDRRGSQQSAAEEESEMWKDLLTTETARREQAEDDARKLREELLMLRSERAVPETAGKKLSLNRLKRQEKNISRSTSGESEGTDSRDDAVTASSITLVEQLRHENAELRRDLGAQTSMLTSRNKERERLQQEIEELKLSQRKGEGARSVAGDSIFERSISRQHQRAASRVSGQTGLTSLPDSERDEWERREGALRDQNAALRMDYQELEREFTTQNTYIVEVEQEYEKLEAAYDSAVQDLHAVQKERDDALRALDEREREITQLKTQMEQLQRHAVATIEELEEDFGAEQERAKQLASDLKDRIDDFQALQRELRDLNNSLVQLEDDRAAALKRIESLEHELDELNHELDTQDKKLHEANEKNQRMEVQQESLHSEISFLREEQEGDKIKIGDMENALILAQQSIQDEKEKMEELEEGLMEERRQREIVDNQSKQEVQKVLNDLNDENIKAKDEARRLKRALSTKEVESQAFKKSLDELESMLKRALGDSGGRRTAWLHEIERLQQDMESTLVQLEKTKGELAEKERTLRNRDMLLESSGLESRRLSDLLDKERDARKRDLHQYELMQRGHSTSSRSMAHQESRAAELEKARGQDKRKMALLEQHYRDQLSERNNLLLALWNRLSTLCGVEWSQSNCLVNGELPSPETIARHLPSFNKNIIEAVRKIESIMGSFKSRIRGVEKTLGKDFQTLSNNLDARIKRMDFLERAVKEASAQIEEQAREHARLRATSKSSSQSNEELGRLRQEVKVLKAELRFHKQQANRQSGSGGSISSGGGGGGGGGMASAAVAAGLSTPTSKSIVNTLTRHHSSTTAEQLQHQQQSSSVGTIHRTPHTPIVIATPPIPPSEQRWLHRLKEMERRLKAEREARLLDRRGARQRLEERSAENEELRVQLEREKERKRLMDAEFDEEGDEIDEEREEEEDEEDMEEEEEEERDNGGAEDDDQGEESGVGDGAGTASAAAAGAGKRSANRGRGRDRDESVD